jgi:hypothetical protein
MNLVQITEQLKNPAVSVQQLMQYANNSNPQVPSYVALAEMQRRQSMQAPPQAPQETVKDQLGASLMGLPSVAPSFNAAPQQPPQQPMQPPMQQPMQQQPPMPAPRQAMPQQPGMAGGGLTSIPLDMSHDFAAGGIIAFADGGYPEELALRKEKSIDEVRQEREAEEAKRGIVADPYVEAKRRYAELEARQKAAEKTAGADRFWAGLASYAGSGTKQFGESMGQALKTSQDLGEKQNFKLRLLKKKMLGAGVIWLPTAQRKTRLFLLTESFLGYAINSLALKLLKSRLALLLDKQPLRQAKNNLSKVITLGK